MEPTPTWTLKKPWRVPRMLVVGYFALLALGLGLGPLLKGHAQGLVGTVVLAMVAAFANYMFNRADRAFAGAMQRVDASLRYAAQSGLDAPGAPVDDKYDTTYARVVMGSRGGVQSLSFAGGQGLNVKGTRDGAEWQFASHVMPTRNPPLYYVSSYVRVDLQGADVPFRVAHQTSLGRLASKLSVVSDVELGDAPFDREFRVTGDRDFLLRVLDEATRKELLELSKTASTYNPFFGLEIEVVRGSLVMHWPGELNEKVVDYGRYLLGKVRAQLLEALAHKARTGVRVGGLRASGDVTGEAEQELERDAMAEAERAARGE